jgi:hypothetical protein
MHAVDDAHPPSRRLDEYAKAALGFRDIVATDTRLS